MLKILRIFFRPKETADGLNQDQREAIVDLLLICMYADNDLDLNEERVIDREVGRYAWASEETLEAYLKSAEPRIRQTIFSEKTRNQEIQKIAKRLKSEEVKYQALKLCRLLFYADGQLDEQEVVFINEIEAIFGMR